ncbi:hypothetical protein EON80_18985 [bacterium]|nr:MAG: hypothetical protein EON80_18985 [bacterium]
MKLGRIFLSLLWLFLVTNRPVQGQENVTRVVAKVDDKVILYEEIRTSEEVMRLRKSMASGGMIVFPGNRATPESASELKHALEAQELANRINKILYPILFDKYGIVVGDEELKNRVDKRTESLDLSAIAAKTRKTYAALLNAFSSVYEKHEKKDAAYAKFLKPYFTKDQWDAYLPSYRSLEKRKSLRVMTQVTPDILRKSLEVAFKQELQEEKLNSKINEILSLENEEFRSDLALLALKPTNSDLDEKRKFVHAKRREWWLSTYKSFVTVLDQDFSDIFGYLAT